MTQATLRPLPERTPAAALDGVPPTIGGKFFFVGEHKLYLRGVAYGPFGVADHGFPFPPEAVLDLDLRLMAEAGVNCLRTFTVPPRWLLDRAAAHGIRVLVTIPWAEHVCFLDRADLIAEIRGTVRAAAQTLSGHPALFGFLVGNEIPPDVVRWYGPERIRRFLRVLVEEVRQQAPQALVSYANFPSTEYLDVQEFTDFLAFNVYLHREADFRRYISRLHNLAEDRPLVLTEFGVDSIREGRDAQAEYLSWMVRAAFEGGVAGTFVFSWTDDWFTGGAQIADWAFGLVDAARKPKPAFAAVRARYTEPLPPRLERPPRVSVVVCAYNAERTMDACLASLRTLNYPDYEVIVVNDGSTDRTLEIAERHAEAYRADPRGPRLVIISQENRGLSVARNVGAEAATGEIVAYTDSDCVADPDWLTYLVGKMEESALAACGGPNFPPPEDALVPAAVAVSPGGPTHVLISDEIAEHIAGCNMAFRRDALLGLGGFDPVYRAAGDDVDICWRFQDAGHVIGFSPAATVWHFRRNTAKAYINQQRGYGKAEALVYAKHPFRFNLFGQAKWLGRIYGDLSAALLLSRKPVIYSGVFGRGLFQTMYEPPSSLTQFLPLTFEWSVAALLLAPAGIIAGGWFWLLTVPLLVTWAMCINGALKAPIDRRFTGLKARALVALLIYLGPLLRGWERLKWRLKATKTADHVAVLGTEQPARFSWRTRSFTLSYWSEDAAEKEALLGGLMDFLLPQKYFVVVDTGWSNWDLKISRGLWSRALVMVCAENHGGMKRLLRVRCAMRLSSLARFLVRAYAALIAASLIFGSPGAAAVFAAIGLVNVGVIGNQGGVGPHEEAREAGEAHRAAHPQQTLHAAMVLGADHDERAAPQAARDLEVPVAPAGIDDDEIFLRQQEIHEAAEQRLFLGRILAPIGKRERTRAPREARRLLGAEHRDMVGRLGRLQPPLEPLPAAQQRAEIDQQRHQRARLQSSEAPVDRRLQRPVDAHCPGHEQRHGQKPEPAAGDDAGRGQQQCRNAPLEGQRQELGQRRRRLVHRLEQAAPEHAGIDDGLARQQQRRRQVAVNPPEPFRLAEQVEAERMLGIDERLCLAIAALLVDVGLRRVAAEMPDRRRRAEADDMAGVLKPPADIDVVAGRAIDRVEAAQPEQRVAAEGHVAAGDVLGDLVADQDVGRPPRRHRHGCRHQGVFRRRKIGPAASGERALLHLADEIGEPVGIGDAVAIGIGDDLAGRRLGADVARNAQPAVRLADDAAIGVALGDFEGAVGRAVVDDDDLIVGVVELFERRQALVHRPLGVVRAHNDGDARIARQRRRQAGVAVIFRDGVECRLRAALPVDEPEIPVFDAVAAGKPLVGPGEDEGAGDAGGEGGSHLPAERMRLLRLAGAHRVHAELGQHQRLVHREVVEPRDVAAERALVVQVDVEAEKIGEVDRQVFGRGIVRIADERARMLLLDQSDETLQEAPHRLDPVPPDHVRRDLVADEIGEDRGMAAAGPDAGCDRGADFAANSGAVEEGDVLRPGQPDQHLETGSLRRVEQPHRRYRKNAHRVDPRLAHQRKVGIDHLPFRKRSAVTGNREWSVGDAADEVLGLPGEEELAVNPHLGRPHRQRRVAWTGE